MAVPELLRGVRTREQARAVLGRRQLASLLADGRLRELVLDPATRASAALLFAGERAVLTGMTAAHLHGCPFVATPTVHVLLPYDRRLRSRDGLVVHHGRWRLEDVDLVGGLRVLVLDLVIAELLCVA